MLFRTVLLALTISLPKLAPCQKLTVVVSNVKGEKGYVRVALYNSGKSFMVTPFKTAEAKAKDGHVMVVFPDIPEGDYAATVLHDLNDNKKMDENLLGIPKEGFGFSNDAMGAFGPPGFKECLFPVTGSAVTTGVRLRHY
jgi:uncharacterized protein (DUF2141 family)